MLGAVQGVLLVSALSHELVASWSWRKRGGRQALDITEEHEGSDSLRHSGEKAVGVREWQGCMLSYPPSLEKADLFGEEKKQNHQ